MYMYYIKELTPFYQEKLKKENGGEPIQNSVICKLLGEQWKGLTDEEKKPYKMKSDEDNLRFKRQTEEFKKHGYWIEDGEKVFPFDESNLPKFIYGKKILRRLDEAQKTKKTDSK